MRSAQASSSILKSAVERYDATCQGKQFNMTRNHTRTHAPTLATLYAHTSMAQSPCPSTFLNFHPRKLGHVVCISYCNCCTETAADISRCIQFEAVTDVLYKLVSGAMHYYGLTPIYFRVLSCCKSVTCSAAMNWTRTLHVRSLKKKHEK